jgi:hypothetical protein
MEYALHPVRGFDSNLGHLTAVETNVVGILLALRQLREACLRERAAASASKCLVALLVALEPSKQLATARELVSEVKTAHALVDLARAQSAVGHVEDANATLDEATAAASRLGDLDGIRFAEEVRAELRGKPGSLDARELYQSQLVELVVAAERDCQGTYRAIKEMADSLERAPLTRLECWRALLRAASVAQDVASGLEFSRTVVTLAPSAAWAFLTLGFFEEHAGHCEASAVAYARAVVLARACGDLHHLQHGCTGLARLGRQGALENEADRDIGARGVRLNPNTPAITDLVLMDGLYWADIYAC